MQDFWRLDPEESRIDFLKRLAQFDEPAFLRRARRVEGAWTQLVANCQAAHTEMLSMVRMRLAMVGALIDGDWSTVAQHLQNPADSEYLAELFRDWQPRLRSVIESTQSRRKIRFALLELNECFERFNVRWSQFLGEVNLDEINRLRVDYNNYYVLEKACAFQSERIARAGYSDLPAVTLDELAAIFPLLKVPQLRSKSPSQW